MSCYQLLSLNNNTGDLQITQGNTVNLAQVIQNFSVRTPVVDFKLDGSVLSLYYYDGKGNLQVKTVTLPTPGNGNTAISVTSTSSISSTLQAGVITSNVNVSSVAGNALIIKPDGLYVPTPSLSVGVQTTSSIALANNSGVLSATAIISPFSGNALTIRNDGLYVPPGTLSGSQVRNFFSATAPVQFDATTGVISETQANTTTAGYLTAVDWNTFNSKVSGATTVGSSSSAAVFKQEDGSGNLQIRSIGAGTGIGVNLIADDIIISTTATVPVVNAGSNQTITLPTSSTTLSGTSSVSNGSIVGNQWLTLSGPNVPTFSDTSSVAPTISGLIAGTYRFRMVAVSSTGLVGVGNTSVLVNSGSVTLDTIYVGVQSSATPPNAGAVAAGNASSQNGANDVSADWTALTASTPFYCWCAIPNSGGTYFKTKWFIDPLNHGNMGTPTDLFGAPTQVTISSVVYNVWMTAYVTQFTGVTLLQA